MARKRDGRLTNPKPLTRRTHKFTKANVLAVREVQDKLAKDLDVSVPWEKAMQRCIDAGAKVLLVS